MTTKPELAAALGLLAVVTAIVPRYRFPSPNPLGSAMLEA